MSNRVENINLEILVHCREQIGLSLIEVTKKIPKISSIEAGELKPTYTQLDTLADLYRVPRWVFISDKLPEQFKFQKKIPAFRKFASNNSELFNNHKIRSIIARIDKHRELILDLSEDISETIPEFQPPIFNKKEKPKIIADIIRKWLNKKDGNCNFFQWKEKLEKKGIFVFLTSKFKGWSFIDKNLIRGLSLYYPILPIILINDSDPKKAQSFTLFHELAHLVRKESSIDNWQNEKTIEKWCDEVSANVLMPEETFLKEVTTIDSLKDIKNLSKKFHVSNYACLVRLRQLRQINQKEYKDFEKEIIEEYERNQKKLKNNEGGPPRNRSSEIFKQYGKLSTSILFQAYHNQELSLNKLMKQLELKKYSAVSEIESLL